MAIFLSKEYLEKTPNTQDKNHFELIGTVGDLHKFSGGIHVDVRVPYDNGKVQAFCMPTVTFYGNEAVQTIEKMIDVSKHPKVCIVGMIHTRRSDKNGEAHYYQDLVGDSISFVNGYVRSNEIRIEGVIANLHYPSNENNFSPCVMVTVRTMVDGRIYFPKIIGFEHTVHFARRFKEGDRIMLYGSAFTRNRYEDTGWKFYQSIVITGVEAVSA